MSLALRNPREGLLELDRLDCEGDLGHFLKSGWRYIDPAPYVHGYHLDAIAEHLEAVTAGQIRRLIINVPPRHSKSSIVSVAWPAWTWAQRREGPLSGPAVQFLSASYAQPLSTRDALKSRRLIQSPWYQERWGDRFALTSDQNAKMRYDNDQGGYRIATSVGGGLTGEGGSIILVDDPLNANEALSEPAIDGVIEWWDGAMSTRLNDPKTGAYVVIMQRLHERDLTGHILSSAHANWEHLCLPARYEPDRHCMTSIGWEDWRQAVGEILSPDRFGDAELTALERQLGSYGTAGQLQQRPAPKGGGILKRDMWELWGNPDDDDDPAFRAFPPFEFVLASLDGAYTEKQENDPCALTLWGVWRDKHDVPRLMLMTAWRERLELHALVEKTHKTCKRFRVDTVLIEAKASGLSVAQELRRLYASHGYGIETTNPDRDKVARAYAVQPIFENGTVYAPDRAWADMVITECESFPKGKHDDLVDTTTQALRWLRDRGLLVRTEEHEADLNERRRHRGAPPKPLYPGMSG